jgi:2-oxoglutarate ferredoxin oxidoreductase subunit gamma
MEAKDMHETFVFSGFGGQGVMFAGQLLAHAALDAGLSVTWIPSYGPEMRGGTAHCFVVMADTPIGSPIARRSSTVVVFNNPSFDKYEPLVEPGGLLAIDSTLVERTTHRIDITLLPVPAHAIADELGLLRLANVVMLGAVLAVRPVVPPEMLQTALERYLPAHRRDLLDLNYAAVERGIAFAHSLQPMRI